MRLTICSFLLVLLSHCVHAQSFRRISPLPVKSNKSTGSPTSFYSDLLLAEDSTMDLIGSHREHAQQFAQYNIESDSQWDSLRALQGREKKSVTQKSRACNLEKRVYGWHPYWSNGLQSNYDWSGLTDLCYFSYDVNASTGNASSTHGWSTAAVVTDAQNNGVNVTLCATLFSNHSTFFASSTAQQTLITNLISLVQSRSAHGVNIDFEGMGASHKVPFTNFMISLCNQMHAAIPGSEVSLALYAVDWNGVFDMAALDQYVDLFIIMGYDYYYSGSTTAGPEAPLYNFVTSYNYTLPKSITFYLKQGASKEKLLLGLPWYGREWATSSGTIPSATTGAGTSSVTYTTMRDNTSGYYSTRQWDPVSFSSYFTSMRSGSWWQTFIDDRYSMAKKFDLVNQRGIGGIGIWALGYDDGYPELWDLIAEKFSDCAVVPCSDTLYDMGGPSRNYYDNEDYTFTISPAGASAVSLDFSSFSSESGYDTLWIYDGSSSSAALIGAYSGTASPGLITSTGPEITIRFKSDNGTIASGYQFIYNCINDMISPVTTVSAPTGWVTADFTATYTDTDNAGGSGIAKGYYQVLENNGTEWRANNSRGFFSDNFDAAIHSDWTSMTGNWSLAGAVLKQDDEANANTNIYAPLTQNLSNQYLYNWKGRITGSGSNRRAGLHYFCDDATQSNRGNSYFIWLRPDQGSCEFYKVISNTFYLQHTVPATINVGQWYDYKVIYDRITGKTDVYQDDQRIGSWTDASPYANGNAISFRSGNCIYEVNDLKVYRSRAAGTTVLVGPAVGNDIRFQNSSPANPSGRVKSLCTDAAGNISAVAAQDVNVDWTAPSDITVADGTSSDIDVTSTATEISGNWTISSDPHSSIAQYWYSAGTAPGTTDLIGWTNNASLLTFTQSGLSLSSGQTYYINVRAENGAGLVSTDSSTDGQTVMISTSVSNSEGGAVSIFPNPTKGEFSVTRSTTDGEMVLCLLDLQGRLVLEPVTLKPGEKSYRFSSLESVLSKGIYLLRISTATESITEQLIIQ